MLACPFPAARTRQPSFMMIFTIEEHSLCLWIHISRTSNSVGFRSPTQFELAFKSSPSSSSLTELGPLFRHPLLSVFLRLVPRVHFAHRLASPLSLSNLCAIMGTGPSVVEPTSDPEEGNATAGERHDTSPENIATWSHSRRRMRLVQTLLFHCTKNRAYVLTVRQFDIDSHLLFGDCIRNIFRVKSIKIYVVLKRHSVRAGEVCLGSGLSHLPSSQIRLLFVFDFYSFCGGIFGLGFGISADNRRRRLRSSQTRCRLLLPSPPPLIRPPPQ